MFNKNQAAVCLGLWICLAAPAAWADPYQVSAAHKEKGDAGARLRREVVPQRAKLAAHEKGQLANGELIAF